MTNRQSVTSENSPSKQTATALSIPTASSACWAILLLILTESSYKFFTVYIFPREDRACGLLRLKYTIKIRFFFFPPLLLIISWWSVWHICQPHKACKWVLHGDEILHGCHSKSVDFEKNVLRSVNTSPNNMFIY